MAQAQLAGQQQLAQAPVLAGLANQGYQSGVQTALSQQQAQAQGAYSLGALGTAGQNAALTGAGAQVGAGTLQQSTQQAQDQTAYQQFLQQQAYPFQTTQWLAGIDTGVGSQLGGTSTSNGSTTSPAPSPFGQIAGLGLAAAGAFLKDGGAVRGFDTGGGIGGTPYAGSSGWVPSIGITAGHGAPSPQGGPNAPAQQQQMDPLKMASSAADLSKKLQGGFGFGTPMNIDSGGYAGTGGFDLGTEGGVTGGLGGLYARGGHVRGYDDGGMVAGLYVPTFDQRFNGSQDIPSPLDTAQWPAGPVNAPGPIVKGDQPSPLDTAAYPAGPVGAPGIASPSIAPEATPQAIADTSKPIAGIAAEPATGTVPITPSLAGDKTAPTQGYAANIANLSHAVKTVESGGNYQAVGPQTRTGDRAYGAYQVMGANIPQWTKEVLGQSLTPQQFLASTEAQDAVARAKLGQYANKYGPEGAAKAWFAGEGGMNNPNATDALGTTVSNYGQKVMAALGQTPNQQTAGLGDATLPPNDKPTQYQGQKPEVEQGPLGKLLSGVGINLSPAAKQAILSAGFGMMASRSPFAANAIGEGGLQGMKTYSESKAVEQSGALANRKVDFEAKKLSQAADQAAQRLALDTSKFTETQQQHAAENMKPVIIGQGILGPIYGIRDPKSGQYRTIDPKTGQIGDVVPPNQVRTQPTMPVQPNVQQRSAESIPETTKADVPESKVATAFGTEDDAAFPLRKMLTSYEAPQGVHPEVLEDPNLTPGQRAKVKAIGDGKAAFLSIGRGNAQNQYIMDKAYEYNPNLDQNMFSRRQKTENFYAVGTQGGGGQNIVAINRWLAHSGSLLGLAEKLNMGDYTTINGIKNELARRGIGSKEAQDILGAWDVNAKGVAGEAAKVFAGSNTALADRSEWEKVLSPDTPLHTIKAKLQQATDMGEQALAANVANYNEGMRTNHSPREFLTPRSAQILDALKSGQSISSLTNSESKSAAPVTVSAVPPIAEREIGKIYQTPKGPATWTNTGWRVGQ